MYNEITHARTQTQLSQNEFALALGIPIRTLQEWEQKRRKPSGAARALIQIAKRHPDLIRENLEYQINRKKQAAKMLNTMTNHLLNGNEIAFSDLILDWYREGFECQSVAKPQDRDELRLTIKASLIERLVEVLNSPPHNESEKIPKWCVKVGAFKRLVKLQSDRLLQDEDYCETFKKRNLLVVKNFMFFI